MKQTGLPLSELAGCMAEYPQKLVSFVVPKRRPLEDMSRYQEVRKAAQEAMGDAGRIVVRYSGTEAKLRVLVEARDAALVDDWTGKLVAVLKEETA
jgi:phosphoglucosamine mutase